MIDIKCWKVKKVYRGQDFYNLYCCSCEQKNRATIKKHALTCPNLRYYESYKPKRRVYVGHDPGELATLYVETDVSLEPSGTHF